MTLNLRHKATASRLNSSLYRCFGRYAVGVGHIVFPSIVHFVTDEKSTLTLLTLTVFLVDGRFDSRIACKAEVGQPLSDTQRLLNEQ